MSNQFDRHAFDEPNVHNAHLKVGGLEAPCAACVEKDQQLTVERNWNTEAAKQNTWLRNRVAELEKSQGIGADAGEIETLCNEPRLMVTLNDVICIHHSDKERIPLGLGAVRCPLCLHGVIDSMSQALSEKDAEIARLKERIEEMSKLLDALLHKKGPGDFGGIGCCDPDCPRCAWEAMKAKP